VGTIKVIQLLNHRHILFSNPLSPPLTPPNSALHGLSARSKFLVVRISNRGSLLGKRGSVRVGSMSTPHHPIHPSPFLIRGCCLCGCSVHQPLHHFHPLLLIEFFSLIVPEFHDFWSIFPYQPLCGLAAIFMPKDSFP